MKYLMIKMLMCVLASKKCLNATQGPNYHSWEILEVNYTTWKKSGTSSNIHVIVNYFYDSSNSDNISRDACVNKIFSQFTFYSSRHPSFFMVIRFSEFLQPGKIKKSYLIFTVVGKIMYLM